MNRKTSTYLQLVTVTLAFCVVMFILGVMGLVDKGMSFAVITILAFLGFLAMAFVNIWILDKNICAYCGRKFDDEESLIEHEDECRGVGDVDDQ